MSPITWLLSSKTIYISLFPLLSIRLNGPVNHLDKKMTLGKAVWYEVLRNTKPVSDVNQYRGLPIHCPLSSSKNALSVTVHLITVYFQLLRVFGSAMALCSLSILDYWECSALPWTLGYCSVHPLRKVSVFVCYPTLQWHSQGPGH